MQTQLTNGGLRRKNSSHAPSTFNDKLLRQLKKPIFKLISCGGRVKFIANMAKINGTCGQQKRQTCKKKFQQIRIFPFVSLTILQFFNRRVRITKRVCVCATKIRRTNIKPHDLPDHKWDVLVKKRQKMQKRKVSFGFSLVKWAKKYNGMSIIMVILVSKNKKRLAYATLFLLTRFAGLTFIGGV